MGGGAAQGRHLLRVAALVGMVLDGRLAVRLLDLIGASALRDVELCVVLGVVALLPLLRCRQSPVSGQPLRSATLPWTHCPLRRERSAHPATVVHRTCGMPPNILPDDLWCGQSRLRGLVKGGGAGTLTLTPTPSLTTVQPLSVATRRAGAPEGGSQRPRGVYDGSSHASGATRLHGTTRGRDVPGARLHRHPQGQTQGGRAAEGVSPCPCNPVRAELTCATSIRTRCTVTASPCSVTLCSRGVVLSAAG